MQKPTNFPTEPEHIWNRFFEITQIPRPSKHEEKFRNYLIKFSEDKKLKYEVDSVGNLIIYVPGTKGKENNAPVVIQNHMDMVADATPDRKIDFLNDPITTYVEDGWIKADRTTLGADNGIGCAMAMALVDDATISHPPLELLFTIDEETGLNGALGLNSSLIKGRKMINLDTEDWGDVFVGCAGGVDYEFKGKLGMKSPTSGKVPLKLKVGNLKGGHSGCDIHLQLGNSIKLLGEALFEMQNLNFELSIFDAGKAHNIIPRDSEAVILVDSDKISDVEKKVSELRDRWSNYLSNLDNDLTFEIEKLNEVPKQVLDGESQNRILNLFVVFPHGPHSFILDLKDMVRMSNNFAICRINQGEVYIQTSLRFTDRKEAIAFEHKLNAIGEIFDIKANKLSEYPSWNPNFDSKLLELVKIEYKKLFSEDMGVKAIHAGLECGILLDKLPGAEAISIGPNLKAPHSPSERLEIDSTVKTWELVKAILGAL